MNATSFQLLLGTGNADKAKEIQSILAGQVTLLTRKDYPFSAVDEDGDTLEANARKKAQTISQETNLPVLAEDTGLEVKVLQGAPGVYSARYAGEDASYADNVEKLLQKLKGKTDRRAHFRCACVIYFPDGQELLSQSQLNGAITATPRGRGGFGYDSIFTPDGFSKTLAELPADVKNKISHRAKALQTMKKKLAEFLQSQD